MHDEDPSRFTDDPRYKRVDLHCHSRYSVFKYFRRANTRDSYNDPFELYKTAKERGMSYITLSDHDSIDGALRLLNDHPDLDDFFISEEVETYFPETGQRVHIGVYDLDEEEHREIQRLRPDIRELVPWMRSRDMLFGVNHLFQNYRMKSVRTDYISEMIEMFDIFEVMNGAMAGLHNRTVFELVSKLRERGRTISMVGGSDAHTLKHVGKVYTVAEVDSLEEFLQAVRNGNCFAWGTEMRFRDLVLDIYVLMASYYDEGTHDLRSPDHSSLDKAVQIMARLASIPTAVSGLPAVVTSLNYLKQIVVSKGVALSLTRIVERLEIIEEEIIDD